MRKMMLVVMSLMLTLSLGATGAWGGVLDFSDVTLIQNWSGAGHKGAWQDVVGTDVPFNTFKATFDTSSHVLTMFTNWDPTKSPVPTGIPGVNFSTADLFLNFNPLTNAAFAAVTLGNLLGANTGTVFFNPTFKTSQDLFLPSGLSQFGGVYTTNINSAGPPSFKIPVKATGGTSTGTATVTWASLGATEPLFSFAIDLDDIAGLNTNNASFLWGTATCGNDVITGTVPVPPTLLLLGSGLLGLGFMRRRMKQ